MAKDSFDPTTALPVAQSPGDDFDPSTAQPVPAAGILRKAGDLGLSVAKGVIGVPEAAVGVLDIPTGGTVGKFLENEGGAVGVRFKQAKDYLSSFQSDDLQAKQKQFQDADGVLDKAGVALSNPSLLANAVAESVPSIGASGVAARGLLAAAPRIGAVAAGALGEGAVSAGSAASNVRQETEDGLLTAKQSGLAAATGAATAAFGFAGGKLAQRMGIGDVDTMLTQGAIKSANAQNSQAPAPAAAVAPGPTSAPTVEAAGVAVTYPTTGVAREPSPNQAVQASPQPAQAGAAPAADAAPSIAAAPAPHRSRLRTAMAARRFDNDLPRSVRGGGDIWDEGAAGAVLADDAFPTAASTQFRRWNGAAWVVATLKRSAPAWTPAAMKRWNGTTWVQV